MKSFIKKWFFTQNKFLEELIQIFMAKDFLWINFNYKKNKDIQNEKESLPPISRRIDSRGRSLKKYLEKKATAVGRNVSARMSQFGNYVKK